MEQENSNEVVGSKEKNQQKRKMKVTLKGIIVIIVIITLISIILLIYNSLKVERVIEDDRVDISSEETEDDRVDISSEETEEENEQINSGNSQLNGSSWISQQDSNIIFENNKEFKWYQTYNDLTDNFYSGEYKFYREEKALEYLAEDLEQYGITKSEMDDYFKRNAGDEDYNRENLVCIVLDNQETVLDNEVNNHDDYNTYYYGFIVHDDMNLDITNMDTGATLNFERQK